MPQYQTLFARAPRKQTRRRGNKNQRKGYFATILVLACILLPLLARIHLDRATLKMGRTWETRKSDLHTLAQKTENLRIERESYLRGDYIRARAAQLGLRPALPGQVRFIQMADTNTQGASNVSVAGSDVP